MARLESLIGAAVPEPASRPSLRLRLGGKRMRPTAFVYHRTRFPLSSFTAEP
jgi:hypothetical protein